MDYEHDALDSLPKKTLTRLLMLVAQNANHDNGIDPFDYVVFIAKMRARDGDEEMRQAFLHLSP